MQPVLPCLINHSAESTAVACVSMSSFLPARLLPETRLLACPRGRVHNTSTNGIVPNRPGGYPRPLPSGNSNGATALCLHACIIYLCELHMPRCDLRLASAFIPKPVGQSPPPFPFLRPTTTTSGHHTHVLPAPFVVLRDNHSFSSMIGVTQRRIGSGNRNKIVPLPPSTMPAFG